MLETCKGVHIRIITGCWSFRRQAEAFMTDALEENKSRIDANEAFQEIFNSRYL